MIKPSSPYLMANSVPRAKFCQLFPSAVSVQSVPRFFANPYPPLVSLSPLPKHMYVFVEDLKRLAADLESTDDKAAVVRRYERALVAKGQVCCDLSSGLGFIALIYLEVCASIRKAGEKGENRQRGHT